MATIVDLTGKTREELLVMAKELEPYIGKLGPALGDGKLREAVAAGLLKQQKKVEEEVQQQAQLEKQEKIGAAGRLKGHPSPETIAIEASRKVYAKFLNIENPGADGELGADVKFFLGEKYLFHLWDQQRHVLPECLVKSDPESDSALVERMRVYWEGLGLKGNHALKQAKTHLRRLSLVNHAVSPRTERRFNAKEDEMVTVIVGHTPRFQFTEIEPAPADAEYGLVIIKETNSGENTLQQSAA